MKCKWGSCFILLIVIVITVFGIFEKRTYTNIAEDKSYLDELYVAQLPENICLEETENLSVIYRRSQLLYGYLYWEMWSI